MRAMLLGIWKSVEELENTISLPELTEILKAAAEREHNDRIFMAALKGIKLDDSDEKALSFEEVQRRADAQLAGVTTDELEFADIGLDYEG